MNIPTNSQPNSQSDSHWQCLLYGTHPLPWNAKFVSCVVKADAFYPQWSFSAYNLSPLLHHTFEFKWKLNNKNNNNKKAKMLLRLKIKQNTHTFAHTISGDVLEFKEGGQIMNLNYRYCSEKNLGGKRKDVKRGSFLPRK